MTVMVDKAKPGFRHFFSFRFQIVIAVLLAVILPVTVRWGANFENWFQVEQFNTIVGSTAAIVVGMLSLRHFETFPGVTGTSFILPSIGVSFLAVLAIFLFGRIEYNRFLFPVSFIVSVVWIYIFYAMSRQFRRPRMAIIPMGNFAGLTDLDGVDWSVLAKPRIDAVGWTGVVADLRVDLEDEWERFIADCALAGVRVFHVKQVRESLTGRVEIEHLSENTLGSLNPDSVYLQFKQLVDWCVALSALIILAPLFVIVAALIKADSVGPVFFRQTRIGFRGKSITVYKFRSMVTSLATSEGRREAMTKTDDPRITKIGKIIRRTRIDELPQLINILRGEMSWIGPRPEAAVLSEWYERELPYYRYRHIVRPGISGWAQVNQGHVTDVDQVLEKLHYDFYYIKNFSLWLDFLIVLRSIQTVFTGSGAK